MVLQIGLNCGFVSVAPTSDPTAGQTQVYNSTRSSAGKFTSPTGAGKIVEIGWWCNTASTEANFEVGVYTHNVGDDEPEALEGKSSETAKGTTVGWKKVTGLNIPISEETIYWLAFQIDTATPNTYSNQSSEAGERWDVRAGQTTLVDPWGTSSIQYSTSLLGVYAIWEEVAGGVNPKVKVSGTFATKKTLVKIGGTFAEKPVKVKVSGTFQ